MSRVVRLVSDITGAEANEDEFITLVVREHPAVDQPKQLDVLPAEVADLKSVKDLVVIEIKNNGESRDLVMSHAEFKKLVPDEVVVKAQSTRGRRLGYSPRAQ